MGVSKESISKFLIGNRFHVKLRILSPYSNRSDLITIVCHGYVSGKAIYPSTWFKSWQSRSKHIVPR